VPPRRSVVVLLFALPLALLAGCQKDEEIKSYEVPQPERETIRLLAAIVPHGEQTWFVRLSGPEAEVAGQKTAFDDFVKSIRFDDSAKPPIQWTLPGTWEQQGGEAMAAFSFRIPTQTQPLLATVTVLGKLGGGENSLAGNVNRWRKQIKLPPVAGPDLERLIQPIGSAMVVDMIGIGVANKTTRKMPVAERPEQHPAPAPGPATKGLPFRYQVPEGWEPIAGGQFSSIGYDVVSGKAKARVTITGLAGDGGGVLFNLKRWRQDKGQAALPAIPDAEIVREARTLAVAGIEATYADFSGNDLRILGVILPLRDRSWFIKMIGPPDLVGRQKANFEAFVKSFKLD
jgi:hypothetical protein